MICHILSALDGKITGAFMEMKAAQTASEYMLPLELTLIERNYLRTHPAQ